MEVSDDILNLVVWLCALMVVGVMVYDAYKYRVRKPKYRINKKGFVEYRNEYGRWRPVCIWNSEVKKRKFTVHDTIRHLQFELEYDGEGREYITSYDSLTYKSLRELENDQEVLIDKENLLLKEIYEKYTKE